MREFYYSSQNQQNINLNQGRGLGHIGLIVRGISLVIIAFVLFFTKIGTFFLENIGG